MATIRNTLIFGAASLGLIASPVILQGASAAAEKLQQDSLKAECNPDWGPSTQTIRGQQIKCNMPAPTNI